MNILVVEDDELDALAIQRELQSDYKVDLVTTLQAAINYLANSSPRPDVIITDLSLPDSRGLATVRDLQQASTGIPIIISSGLMTDNLRDQIRAIGPTQVHDKNDGFSLLRAFLQHEEKVNRNFETARAEIVAELDKVAEEAAQKAVDVAIDRLLIRLHLHDEEAVHMAIRLARAWETAKARFLIAIANGLAGAFLVAIGAGIIALVRHGKAH